MTTTNIIPQSRRMIDMRCPNRNCTQQQHPNSAPKFQPGETTLADHNKTTARIYCTDAGGRYSIHGSYWSEITGVWIPTRWTKDGEHAGYAPLNILPNI